MKLNRSLSFSEMPTNKSLDEEWKFGEEREIVKRFSCEQVSYIGKTAKFQRVFQEFSVSKDNVPTLKSWAFNFEGPISDLHRKILPNQNKGNDSVSKPTSTETIGLPEEKVRSKKVKKDITTIRSLTKKQDEFQKEKKPKRNILFIVLPIVVLFIAVLAISSMQIASYRRICEMKLNVQEINLILQHSVHGQESAINEITTELNTFNTLQGTQMKILVFIGGVGVGKSYSASIISTNFLWDTNVQEFVMPIRRSLLAKEISSEFSRCGDNLLVIDDLKPKDTEIMAGFLNELLSLNSVLDTRVLVVLVFTTQNEDSNKIHNDFEAAGLSAKVIRFQPLEQETVQMCIEESLFRKGVKWNKDDVQKVLENVPQDIGCKGVSSKVHIVMTPGTLPAN